MMSLRFPLVTHQATFSCFSSAMPWALAAWLSCLTWQGRRRGCIAHSVSTELDLLCRVLVWAWEEDASGVTPLRVTFNLAGKPYFSLSEGGSQSELPERRGGRAGSRAGAPALRASRPGQVGCLSVGGPAPERGGSSWHPGRCTPSRSHKTCAYGVGSASPAPGS